MSWQRASFVSRFDEIMCYVCAVLLWPAVYVFFWALFKMAETSGAVCP